MIRMISMMRMILMILMMRMMRMIMRMMMKLKLEEDAIMGENIMNENVMDENIIDEVAMATITLMMMLLVKKKIFSIKTQTETKQSKTTMRYLFIHQNASTCTFISQLDFENKHIRFCIELPIYNM